MPGIELSARLLAVAGMVTKGMHVYDVGCDHAFLDIYLVSHGIAPDAVAADVRSGPLGGAKIHIAEAGLEDRIRTVLSDGLHNIPTPPDGTSLVMAGMGGPLIISILSALPDVTARFDEIVISPQSRIEDVRAGIRELGLVIADERMVYDAGKYYTVIRLVPYRNAPDVRQRSSSVPDNADDRILKIYDRYGYALIKRSDPVLKDFLAWELGILQGIKKELEGSGHDERYRQVLQDIADNMWVTDQMEG